MRVLRLRAYYDPEITAASHLSKDMDGAYAARGIINVNYTPMPTRGISDETRRTYKTKKHEILYDGYVIINRFSMFREHKSPIQRAIRYFCCSVCEYCLGVREKGIDVVHCGSTPPTQGMLGALVAKKLSKKYRYKVPFVYNLQDIFPDSLVNAGMTKEGSLIWKIGRKIEDYTYRNADKIIVISDDFKKNIVAKGVPEDKVVIVPNWADTDGIQPIKREENVLFDRYCLDRNRFYITYCGNIGHTQNMDLLLDVAKEIKDELLDVVFVLVGDGVAKEGVEKRMADEKIDNVVLLPFQPYEEIAHVFSLGDVGLIISKPGIGNNSVPSKTWNYMAAGKPILCSFDKNSQISATIDAIGCGIAVPADDKDAFIRAIKEIHQSSNRCHKMGQAGRAYVAEEISKEKCVARYVNTLEQVGCGGGK